MRGATRKHYGSCGRYPHFNPRAPCGARHGHVTGTTVFILFQPTRPLRGATQTLHPLTTGSKFQPTRPLRGATARGTRSATATRNFNPRAPCGARRREDFQRLQYSMISTHAPLAGRDIVFPTVARIRYNFNPRAPCGARPASLKCSLLIRRNFNPRAPCGARPTWRLRPRDQHNFNPRAPCGARHFT